MDSKNTLPTEYYLVNMFNIIWQQSGASRYPKKLKTNVVHSLITVNVDVGTKITTVQQFRNVYESGVGQSKRFITVHFIQL